MSLLHQDSPEDIDLAARGEELTKGTSHVVLAAAIAAAISSIAIAIYFIAGQTKPAITGDIEQVWSHSMKSQTPAYDANGAAMPQETVEQVMVFALVKLNNQSKQPLFVHQIMTNATLDDGIHSSYAASPTQFNELFIVHPELASLQGKALSTHTTINPGQSVEGTIVSAFRMTKQQWDARKGLDFTFGIRYQPQLKLAPHAAVIELPE